MTSSRNSILQSISASLDQISLGESVGEPTSDPIISIIHFAKKKWNINSPLYYSDTLSEEDLFESNGLHLREIQTSFSSPPRRVAGNLILLILNTGPIISYNHKGQTFYFNPLLSSDNISTSLPNDFELIDAYEIFRQLPWSILNPLSLLSVSISGDRSKFILIGLVSLLVMLLGLSTPILTGFLTNTVIPSSSVDLLLQTLIPCSIILIVSSLMNYFQGLALLLTETSVDLKLQSAVWQKVYKLPMHFFAKYTPGDLLSRVQAISAIRKSLGNQALLSVLQLCFSVVFFVLMVFYDWKLAIGAIVITLISLVVVAFTIYRQTLHQLPFVEQQAELTNFAYQSITGLPQIRSTNTESFLLLQWYKKVDASIQSQRNIEFWQGFLSSYSSINQPLGTIVLYSIIVWRLVLSSEAPTSEEVFLILSSFLPFYQAYTSFNGQLQSVISTIGDVVAQVWVQWDRAKPVLYQSEEEGFSPESIPLVLKGQIEFSNIAYSFDTAKPPLFSNVNISIKPGSFTAITGESGCGKSTLMKILLGFLDPTEGSVLIDGLPLRQINIRHYRRQLGVVLQSTKLPPGSIYDIICAGRTYTDDQVWDSLEKCAIADQIREFPMGLETIITESPAISGGQRQRIGLARAIISNPKVLLLDEATSALDAASQKIISDAVANLGITRVVIAHRISTIREADQIIFMSNQTISASGTYDELYQQGLFH